MTHFGLRRSFFRIDLLLLQFGYISFKENLEWHT